MWWLRPTCSRTSPIGVRPNSPPQTTSVESSKSRSRRSASIEQLDGSIGFPLQTLSRVADPDCCSCRRDDPNRCGRAAQSERPARPAAWPECNCSRSSACPARRRSYRAFASLSLDKIDPIPGQRSFACGKPSHRPLSGWRSRRRRCHQDGVCSSRRRHQSCQSWAFLDTPAGLLKFTMGSPPLNGRARSLKVRWAKSRCPNSGSRRAGRLLRPDCSTTKPGKLAPIRFPKPSGQPSFAHMLGRPF